MTIEQFEETLKEKSPPLIGPLLKALWYDEKGDWEMAHALAQSDPTKDGAWVHAYLHRNRGPHWRRGSWCREGRCSSPR